MLLALEALQLGLLLLLEALLDSLAKVLGELAVALLANGLAVPRGELTVLEGLLARVAEKVLRMVRLVKELLAA